MNEYDFSLNINCINCNKEFTINCNESDYNNWKNGVGFIQDILPYLSADDRELLISGTCGKCFDEIFDLCEEEEEEMEVNKSSAEECATYIMDSDCEHVSYDEYVKEGNDPRDHILYHAAVVLNQTEDFEEDINNYSSRN